MDLSIEPLSAAAFAPLFSANTRSQPALSSALTPIYVVSPSAFCSLIAATLASIKARAANCAGVFW